MSSLKSKPWANTPFITLNYLELSRLNTIGFNPHQSRGDTLNESLDHRETSDTYRGELFRRRRYRVIICKDNIQWILQRKITGATPRWAALSYNVTQKALSRAWAAYTGDIAHEIDLLPPTINAQRSAKEKT